MTATPHRPASPPTGASTGVPTGAGGEDAALPVVALACTAPSVANSQPWRWRTGREGAAPVVCLAADPTRWRSDRDPSGRQLLLSCGVALHHAAFAARALGWDPQLRLTEHRPLLGVLDAAAPPTRPVPLARLVLRPSAHVAPPDAVEVLAARCTDRRRFTAWPVPPEHLEALARAAARHGVWALAVTDPSVRFHAGLLADRALSPGELEAADGLVLLGSTTDTPAGWLRTGAALGSLWLEATRAGLTVVPLSAPVEHVAVREALRTEVLAGRWHPHLAVRVGWQALGRHQLERTPRRPLVDVVDVVGDA